jgi:hypothetical protein
MARSHAYDLPAFADELVPASMAKGKICASRLLKLAFYFFII